MDIFNMGAPAQDVSSVELVFHMAVNHLIWRRRCQVLHLEPPLHEGKTVASRATNLIGERQQKKSLAANLPLGQKSCLWGNMMF
jgi:hypothetical protein